MMNVNELKQKIERVSQLRKTPYKILSVYLGTDGRSTLQTSEMVSQLHSTINTLSSKNQEEFRADTKKILNFIMNDYDGSGTRSLAFFASGKYLWQVIEFEFALTPSATVFNAPNLAPIFEKLPHYRRYMVLLVDRKQAKCFTVYLGKLEEEGTLKTTELVPQRVRAIRHEGLTGREDKIFRDIEVSLHRYLQEVGKQAAHFAQQHDIDFILVGSHKELFGKIRQNLPKDLSDKVKAEFVTELKIELNEIVEHSKTVAATIDSDLQ